jgi:hypothetical protein
MASPRIGIYSGPAPGTAHHFFLRRTYLGGRFRNCPFRHIIPISHLMSWRIDEETKEYGLKLEYKPGLSPKRVLSKRK